MRSPTTSILGYLATMAAIACGLAAPTAAAEGDAESVAEAMLVAVGAEVGKCATEDAQLSFERRCGGFAGGMKQFKTRWKKELKRNEHASNGLTVKEGWKHARFEKYCYRAYEMAGRWFRVIFIDFGSERGLIEIQYSSDAHEDTPLPDGPLLAGVGEVPNPVLLPESKVEPVYPETARVMRFEGNVILQAVITRDGMVTDLEVLRAAPIGFGLVEAAVEAVSHWRYEPALHRGEPVDVYFTVFVEFKLK